MPSFNNVVLVGNLTKDPELRYTGGGDAVCNLRIAINRKYKTQSGEAKEEVTYVSVVCWRKQALAVAEYVKKGSPVLVHGRLQSRSWETDSGEKRSALDVVAVQVQFLGKPRGENKDADANAPSDGPADEPAATGKSDDDIPF